MAEKFWMRKEAFITIAEQSGLDTRAEHMDELYAFLRGLLPSLSEINKFSVAHAEPFMPRFDKERGDR
jgi:hypothetical protein